MFVRTVDFRVLAERGDIRTNFQLHVLFWDWNATVLPAFRTRDFSSFLDLHQH